MYVIYICAAPFDDLLIQLDKMLIDYFVNSSMLSIHKKNIKKDIIERIY